MDVDVGIAAQAAFLHFAIGHFDLTQQQANLLEIGLGLFGRREIGLADDLQEGGAGAVEVDQAIAAGPMLVMQHLAGIFFEMGTQNANSFAAGFNIDLQPAIRAEGQVILTDLVVLGQVGIVIILAVPFGKGGNPAIKGQRRLERELKGRPIHDRQDARHADTHRTGRRVGR